MQRIALSVVLDGFEIGDSVAFVAKNIILVIAPGDRWYKAPSNSTLDLRAIVTQRKPWP